jgi:DNA-binding response OmpR family regulator
VPSSLLSNWHEEQTNMSMQSADGGSLQGLRVLVVEDDYFIANEICTALRSAGAAIVGPAPDLETGLATIRRELLDCAVLDINLHGQLVFQIAAELRTRGIPSIFATGYDDSVIPENLADAVRLEKPIDLTALLRAVESTRPASRVGGNGRMW